MSCFICLLGELCKRLRQHQTVSQHPRTERAPLPPGVVHAAAAGHTEPGADRQDGGECHRRHLQLGRQRAADIPHHDAAHRPNETAHLLQKRRPLGDRHETQPRTHDHRHHHAAERAKTDSVQPDADQAGGQLQPFRSHHQARDGDQSDRAEAGAAVRAHGGARRRRYEGYGGYPPRQH